MVNNSTNEYQRDKQ